MLKFGHYELCEEENHASPQASNRKFPEKKKWKEKLWEIYHEDRKDNMFPEHIYTKISIFIYLFFVFEEKTTFLVLS